MSTEHNVDILCADCAQFVRHYILGFTQYDLTPEVSLAIEVKSGAGFVTR
jgi:hypothetical protein